MPAGNPAVEVWGGVKMAQPRLGTAVREVLEAFIEQERAVEGGGLIDMIVSRFGKAEDTEQGKIDTTATTAQPEPQRLSSALPFSLWPSSGNPSPAASRTQSPGRPASLLPLSFTPEPEPILARDITASDGCIFPGMGHLDPIALRDVTKWASNIYLWNEDRVVRTSTRNKKGKRPRLAHLSSTQTLGSGTDSSPPGFRGREASEPSPGVDNGTLVHISDIAKPQSLIPAQRQSSEGAVQSASSAAHVRDASGLTQSAIVTNSSTATSSFQTSNGKLLNILTFGWAGGGSGSGAASSGGNTAGAPDGRGRDNTAQHPVTTEANVGSQPGSPKFRSDNKKNGQPRFLFGYMGDLEDDEDEADGGLNIQGLETSSSRAHSGKITEKVVWLLVNNPDRPPGKGPAAIGDEIEPGDSGELKRSSTDRTLQPSNLKENRIVVYLVRKQALNYRS